MNNSQENKKLNDKGFSLVELIIVIAIMAVLVGVLAPQYLQYVEKSRKSADLDSYQEIISAVQIYYSDVDNTLPSAGTYKIKFTDGAASADDEISDACTDAGVNISQITMKSSAYSNATISFKVESGGTSYFFCSDNSDLAKELAIATS